MWSALLYGNCNMEAIPFIDKHSQPFSQSVLWNVCTLYGDMLYVCQGTPIINGHLCRVDLCGNGVDFSDYGVWICENFYRKKFQKITRGK